MYADLKKPYDEVKQEAHRLKINLIKYEEKYKFIDIGKLHAETQKSIAQADEARLQAAGFKKDLFEIRNRIMEITQKFDKSGKKKKKNQ